MTPPRASLRDRLLAAAEAEVESPAPYLTGDMKFYVHDAELRDLLREAADALPDQMDADGKLRALVEKWRRDEKEFAGNGQFDSGCGWGYGKCAAELEAVRSPVAGPVTDEMVGVDHDEFESWWRSSKYMQVLYCGEFVKQVAADGWHAALLAALESKDEK